MTFDPARGGSQSYLRAFYTIFTSSSNVAATIGCSAPRGGDLQPGEGGATAPILDISLLPAGSFRYLLRVPRGRGTCCRAPCTRCSTARAGMERFGQAGNRGYGIGRVGSVLSGCRRTHIVGVKTQGGRANRWTIQGQTTKGLTRDMHEPKLKTPPIISITVRVEHSFFYSFINAKEISHAIPKRLTSNTWVLSYNPLLQNVSYTNSQFHVVFSEKTRVHFY